MRLATHHPATQFLVILGVSLAGYGRALSRYFVSEDFTILRILWQGSFLENAWAHFTGPWLGVTFVPFYRPISTTVLDLETRLWGIEPTGYLVAHFGIHLANVALLHRVVRHLTANDGAVPFAAALIFALYPLHPNTVLFIGSFAPLFAMSAGLGSFLLLLRSALRGGRLDLVASWACFAAALGSYEASAVLPALFLTRLCLRPTSMLA